MVTKIIDEKEIELSGEKFIVKLLHINVDRFNTGNVTYFRIVGGYKNNLEKNKIRERLLKKVGELK